MVLRGHFKAETRVSEDRLQPWTHHRALILTLHSWPASALPLQRGHDGTSAPVSCPGQCRLQTFSPLVRVQEAGLCSGSCCGMSRAGPATLDRASPTPFEPVF